MTEVATREVSAGDLLRLQAFNALGVKAMEAGNPGGAIPHYEEALTITENAAVLSNLGDALARCGRFVEAKAAFERALEVDPTYHEAPYNLGVVQEQLEDLEGARAAYSASLEIRVTSKALNNAGNVEFRLRDLAAAEALYRKAIKQRFDAARWNLGLCLMMQGKFSEGWDAYEFRPQRAMLDNVAHIWRGEPVAGKSLLVILEQGLGDCVFALRYLPALAEEAAKLTIVTDAPMTRLVRQMGVGEVLERTAGQQNVPSDYVTLAMSIPGYRSPEGTGPNAPYLAVPKVARAGDEFLVGLCWNGSTVIGAPGERNIPLALLAPLAAVKGVKLVSLQQGNAVDEIEGCGFELADPMPGCRDVFDTACVIASLDLVVTIDTLIPHLSGALGKPTWLLNRFASCWQWGLPERDPNLYSTIAQFRQETRGEWAPVVEQLAYGLQHVVTNRGVTQ